MASKPYFPYLLLITHSSLLTPHYSLLIVLPVQRTPHPQKKGTAPRMGQLTDTNNLNFTLLIFYTNFYISFNLFSQFYILLTLYFFVSHACFVALFSCFWCKYMAKTLMLQIKNIYHIIIKTYIHHQMLSDCMIYSLIMNIFPMNLTTNLLRMFL